MAAITAGAKHNTATGQPKIGTDVFMGLLLQYAEHIRQRIMNHFDVPI